MENYNTSGHHQEVEIYPPSPGVIALLTICYGAISVLAVTGNALVMWAVAESRRMQKSATNWLIANLALADIFIGLFAVPFQFQAALMQRWDLPYFMCAFCPFMQTLSVNVSIFTLTALAVRRYRAVARPLREAKIAKWHVKITVVIIWLIAGIIASPMIFLLRVIDVPAGGGTTKPFCSVVGFDLVFVAWYRRGLVFLQYFAPLFVITAVYARLGCLLWGAEAPGNAENSRDARMLVRKKKVIKMLIIVVALFALCWLPLQSYNMLQDIFPKINEFKYINIIWFSCDWLAMSNSFCNPFVYGIYNEKFRHSFESRCQSFRRVLRLPDRTYPPSTLISSSRRISSGECTSQFSTKIQTSTKVKAETVVLFKQPISNV